MIASSPLHAKKRLPKYQHHALAAVEVHLMGLLRSRWPSVAMLDIEVRTGRTTSYFTELAGRYVGIDRNSEYVTACRERFPEPRDHIDFQKLSPLELSAFGDGEFQAVLFSNTGLDALEWGQRDAVLREMKRVCAKDGWVAVDSHNLYCLPRLFHLARHKHPRRFLKEFLRWTKMRMGNAPLEALMRETQVMFSDGTTGSQKIAYVRPEAQMAVLRMQNFSEIRVIGGDGADITHNESAQRSADEPTLGYICRP